MSPNFLKQNVVNSYPTKKAQNYACQICRASREICERCQTAKHLASLSAAPPMTARRGRSWVTLSGYR
jgi:hypothetical protein